MSNTMLTTSTLQDRLAKNKGLLKKTVSGNTKGIGLDGITKASNQAKVSRNKARILKKMSPQLDRALQILSGMITCPEGGVGTKLIYDVPTIDRLSDEKRKKILDELKTFFDSNLNLSTQLHDTVYKVLSETGADVEVYIPMTLIDEVLGVESSGISSLDIDDTRNPIKFNERHIAIDNNMNLLTESTLAVKPMAGNESGDQRSRNRVSRINRTTLAIRNDGIVGSDSVIVRRATGESIIPIEYNGRVILYVGLLDDMGSFITTSDSNSFMDLMSQEEDPSERAQYEMLGHDAGMTRSANMSNEYKTIRRGIEDDVVKAITSKTPGDGAVDSIINSLGEENVLDILTARAMAAKKTRVVMLDPDYVSYFAIIKNEHGRGVTIIEDNSSIILLHVTLLYASILSELEASIPQTLAEVALDPNDSEPDASLRDILGEAAISAIPEYNIDYSGNRELFRSLSKMNTSVKVTNVDVPGMPNMDINVERKHKDTRGPGSDVLERVGKFATQSIGVSSEHVDNSYGERFKLQVARDNDITSRQQQRYVSMVNQCLTDRGRKRVGHNDELWNRLTGIIGGPQESADDILITFLASMSIELPEATSAMVENFSNNIDKVIEGLEKYIQSAIPETIIEGGEAVGSDVLRDMRQMLTGAAVRNYAASSNLFDGLGVDLTSMDGIAHVVNSELESYGDTWTEMVKGLKGYTKTITKAGEKLNDQDKEDPPEEGNIPEETDPTETGGEDLIDEGMPPELDFE